MTGSERRTDRIDLSVVVPLFNERENLEELYRRLTETLRSIHGSYEIVCVDDGSGDGTSQYLDEVQARDPQLTAIHLSRNFGQQAAITAGLDHARGSAVMIIDGDMQDPPEIIPGFVDKWREGFQVVYAIRTARKEFWPLRAAFALFYRTLRLVSELEIPLDSGDCCLLDRTAVDALRALPEHRRVVRGLRSFVGFRQVGLAYERAARRKGDTKHSTGSRIGLALDALVSFSGSPLRIVTYLGIGFVVIAAGLLIWVFVQALYTHTTVRGWASLASVVLFLGAIQMICLGIIGEYLRLIFLETKHRPTYVIASVKRASEP